MTNNTSITNTKKILSIQVSLNGLSFCCKNEEGTIEFIENEKFGLQLNPNQVLSKIKTSFNTLPKLKDSFDSAKIIYQNDLYSVIPTSLFDENLLNAYLNFNVKTLKNDFIAYDTIENHDITIVYIPYANINNYIFDNFGSFTYKHSISVLIDSLLTKEKNNHHDTIYVNINQDTFDLIVINEGNLLLANTFTFSTKEDFIYYLLFTIEQLQLNTEELSLIFLGVITEESELYKIAYTYIRNIKIGGFEKSMNTMTENTKNSHSHYVLLSE